MTNCKIEVRPRASVARQLRHIVADNLPGRSTIAAPIDACPTKDIVAEVAHEEDEITRIRRSGIGKGSDITNPSGRQNVCHRLPICNSVGARIALAAC